MARRLSGSWNRLSAVMNPLIVLTVSILLIVEGSTKHSLLYLLPLAFLAANSLVCMVFWTIRLTGPRGRTRIPALLAVGYAARALGWLGLPVLLALGLGILFRGSWWVGRVTPGPDWKFWFFWSWAILEIVHHHFYKLTFGSRDTLQCVLEGSDWNRVGEPLGGALGIQLRKLRRRASAVEWS